MHLINLRGKTMNLTVGDIVNACEGSAYVKKDKYDECVTSAVIDSRLVTDKGVFIASVGEKTDSHKYIGEVFSKGVSLVITEKTPDEVYEAYGIKQQEWGDYILVKNTFAALRKIAKAYREKLSLPIIGITGSVGKTSTKEFIFNVLSAKYNCLKTEGNFNNEIGVPLTLLRISNEHEAAVVEMGISDFGEMHRLSEMVKPDIAVITNIGQCHLENLKTRDGILQAKTEIFDFMNSDSKVVLNGDDDKLITVDETKTPGNRKPIFFSNSQTQADVYATDIASKGLLGSEITMKLFGHSVKVNVPLPGEHMVKNALCAATVAGLMGLNNEEIAEGMSKAATISGRNNIIKCENYTIIDDAYNASPASMKSSIDLLKMAEGFKVAVLGDMFELGENSVALHKEVGRYAAKAGLNRIIFVGKNAKDMYEEAVLTYENLESFTECELIYCGTLKELTDNWYSAEEEYLPKGSTCLIKASHGMNFKELVEFLC